MINYDLIITLVLSIDVTLNDFGKNNLAIESLNQIYQKCTIYAKRL
jgi:hypothetical protein